MRRDDQRGQGTVEYLVVGLVLVVACVSLASFLHLVQDGLMARQVSTSASHVITSGILEVVGDALFF